MAAPIISDLLLLAVTPSAQKCRADVLVVLGASICGFLGPDVRCAAVWLAGASATRSASSTGICASCCVGALFAGAGDCASELVLARPKKEQQQI